MQDTNDVNSLALSTFVSKIGRVVHTNIGSLVANFESDQCYDRNMSVHYNQKNVVEV